MSEGIDFICKQNPNYSYVNGKGETIYPCRPAQPKSAPTPKPVEQPKPVQEAMPVQRMGGLATSTLPPEPSYLNPCPDGRCGQQGYEMNTSDRAAALARGAVPTKMEVWGELMNQAQYGALQPAAQQNIRTMQANTIMADPNTQRDISYALNVLHQTPDEAIGNSMHQAAQRYGFAALAGRMLPEQFKASQDALSKAAAVAAATGTPLHERSVQTGLNDTAQAQLAGGLNSWGMNADGSRTFNFGGNTIKAIDPAQFSSVLQAVTSGLPAVVRDQILTQRNAADVATKAKEYQDTLDYNKWTKQQDIELAKQQIEAQKQIELLKNQRADLELRAKEAAKEGNADEMRKVQLALRAVEQGLPVDPVTLRVDFTRYAAGGNTGTGAPPSLIDQAATGGK